MISQEFLQKCSTLGEPRFGNRGAPITPRGEKTPTSATGNMPSHATKMLCLWYLRPGSRESFISFLSLTCWRAYRTMTQGCCKLCRCWGWKDPDRLHPQAPKYECGRNGAGCGGTCKHLHMWSSCAPTYRFWISPVLSVAFRAWAQVSYAPHLGLDGVTICPQPPTKGHKIK